MNQIYDETLVLAGFGIEEEKKKAIPQEIENYKRIESLNPKYSEEIITLEKVKNKIFSSLYIQYNIFSAY
ncbi:MAG: hypothetical protein ACXAC5_20075 [Promethearchaeota archaeon]|jgi:hypothetical protein